MKLRITIRQRLWVASAVALLFFVVAIVLGLYGMVISHNSTRSLFDDVILPLEKISIIDQNFRENRSELYLLWDHAPGRRDASGHESGSHGVEEHIKAIEARAAANDDLLQQLRRSAESAGQETLLRRLDEDKRAWRAYIDESFAQARSAAFDADVALRFQTAGMFAYDRLSDSIRALRDAQPRRAERIIDDASERHRAAIGVLVIVGMGGLGVLLFILTSTTERISLGLAEVAGFAEEIAAGNLDADVARSFAAFGDEFDLLMQRITRTRESLKALVSDLRTSEARANAVLRTMRDGVIMISPAGVMLKVNDVVTEMFGYDASELAGRNISMLMPEPHRSAHNGHLAHYMQTREGKILRRRIEVEAVCKDGSTLPIDLVVNEMIDDSGSLFVGVVRDITVQKRTQRALEQALAEAEVATAAKSDFLAKMSHEIRTPISAVLGLSQLAMRNEMDGRLRAYIEKIHGSAQTLLELVNDILDLSKIEAGALELEHIAFDAEAVLQNVKAVCGYRARSKQIALLIAGIGDIPRTLIGDPTRLTQVLMNLVNNAIKFTAEGQITVTAEVMPVQGSSGLMLHFTVRDSGIGIAPEWQDRLFKVFSQADDSMTRRFGGTGLGLAISKQLVEKMGGTIGVVSESGRGATFWFVVPFAVDDAAGAEATERADLQGRTALILDPHPDAPALYGYALGLHGCGVQVCATQAALAARVRTACDFDLVALMGEMTDEDFGAFVRVAEASCPGKPVLLLSSGRVGEPPGDLGVPVFMLQKPIWTWKLAEVFSDVLAARPLHDERKPRLISAPILQGHRILLVDDNELNREIGREMLSMAGLTVDTVNNGQDAVDAVKAAPYDLLLMDLQMPVMDGYTATRTIREFNKDVAIIALTAHAMAGETERVLAAGMDDYLTKPINVDVFYPRIAEWLARKGAGAQPVEARQVETASPPAAPQAAALQVFDIDAALARVAGRRDMLARFVKMYFERNADQFEALEASLVAAEFDAARRHAHALKSGAGTLGLTELQDFFSTLEARLVVGDEAPQATGAGQGMRRVWDKARLACSEALGIEV